MIRHHILLLYRNNETLFPGVLGCCPFIWRFSRYRKRPSNFYSDCWFKRLSRGIWVNQKQTKFKWIMNKLNWKLHDLYFKLIVYSNCLILGRRKGDVAGPPSFFLIFFLGDKTSAPEVSCSCLFILRAHFEKSLVMVRYYGYEISSK